MNEVNSKKISSENIIQSLGIELLQLFSFENLVKFLIIILPFHVLVSVFFEYKIGLHGVGIYKELLLFILTAYLGVYLFIKKQLPKFDTIDYLILGYFAYLLLISVFNHTGLKAIIYGGRYDFEFLLIFLIVRHGRFLLTNKISYYIKIFLISASWAIGIGIIVRFVFGESILLHFGFSPLLSNWSVAEGVPIYHGIEGANIRRFQGIFDGPNQAAFFLIFYSSMLFHYLRYKIDYLLYLFTILFIVIGLIFLTYSRSALLGVFGGLGFLVLLNVGVIFIKYRSESIIAIFALIILGGIFYIRYGGHMEEIVLRAGSSKGHSERMIEGFNQFKEHPLGKGLASSGPGYRATYSPTIEDEKLFIPESWYVQQLVEGGVIGFLLFIMIMILILVKIYPLSGSLFFSFFGVLVMNVVLHTFETSYVSILLFLFLGLFLSKKDKILNKKV